MYNHNALNPVFSTTGRISVGIISPTAIIIFFSLARISWLKHLKCHRETNLQRLFRPCLGCIHTLMMSSCLALWMCNISRITASTDSFDLINYSLSSARAIHCETKMFPNCRLWLIVTSINHNQNNHNFLCSKHMLLNLGFLCVTKKKKIHSFHCVFWTENDVTEWHSVNMVTITVLSNTQYGRWHIQHITDHSYNTAMQFMEPRGDSRVPAHWSCMPSSS